MAKFKFIGTPGEHPKDITVFGVNFPAGKTVDVHDAATINKLQGNPEFEQVSGPAKDEDYTGEPEGKQPKVAPAPDAAARAAADKADLAEAAKAAKDAQKR